MRNTKLIDPKCFLNMWEALHISINQIIKFNVHILFFKIFTEYKFRMYGLNY